MVSLACWCLLVTWIDEMIKTFLKKINVEVVWDRAVDKHKLNHITVQQPNIAQRVIQTNSSLSYETNKILDFKHISRLFTPLPNTCRRIVYVYHATHVFCEEHNEYALWRSRLFFAISLNEMLTCKEQRPGGLSLL